jgi:hypothetical protein
MPHQTEKNSLELIIQIIPDGLASKYLLSLEVGSNYLSWAMMFNKKLQAKIFF